MNVYKFSEFMKGFGPLKEAVKNVSEEERYTETERREIERQRDKETEKQRDKEESGNSTNVCLSLL